MMPDDTDNFHRGEFEGVVNTKLDNLEAGLEKILENQREMWQQINENKTAISNQRVINGMMSGIIAFVAAFLSKYILKG